MITYFDHQCQKRIYRILIDGKPIEFFSIAEAFAAIQQEEIKKLTERLKAVS